MTSVDSGLEIRAIIRGPLFTAAEVGNFEFVAVLLSSYPDLIWEVDDRKRTIIHIAVLHRHASIFNFIYDIGPIKDVILNFTDTNDGNNLLHLAATKTPSNGLQLVTGAPFRMTLELIWFEEVKKIMLPLHIEGKNLDGLTPQEVFTREHAMLRNDAEGWMNSMASSCMIGSTLIANLMFPIAFSITSGIKNTGALSDLKKPPFLIFAISAALALASSSTSFFVFLSIPVSRYAEYDFYKSLPTKLILGLATLFVSVLFMMTAFSSGFYITYYGGKEWLPIFFCALSSVPIIVFLFLTFQFFYDIMYSTFFVRSLFRPRKHFVY